MLKIAGGIFGAFALISGAVFAVVYLTTPTPEPKASATAQATTFSFADGSSLATVGQVMRKNVPLQHVPLDLRHAVLAAEDDSFYSAPAIDPWRTLEAGFRDLAGAASRAPRR